MVSSLVFDLDGTLIDSSPGILSALYLSLSDFGCDTIHVDCTHVGPPLASVFQQLLPCETDFGINQLCNSFRHHYDNSEYLQFKPYDGVAEALDWLSRHGIRLFVATNKRSLPTKKILDLLQWNCYFEFVYCLDMCRVQGSTKANCLSSLVSSFNLDASRTPYLGDRLNDYTAASSASMPFFMAEWGYASREERHVLSEVTCLESPSDLLTPTFLHQYP